MEEISNPTQQAVTQDDLFSEGLADASSPAEAATPVPAQSRDGSGDAAQSGTAPEAPDTQTREARIQADLAGFAAAFPEVFARAKNDPGVIPQCVWDMMHSQGLSLTAAYARHVTDQARIAADNRSNATRSTGSMRSTGSDPRYNDAFLSAFDA